MKKSIIAFLIFGGIANAQQKDYPIQPVTFTQVKLNDHLWLPRIETNRSNYTGFFCPL